MKMNFWRCLQSSVQKKKKKKWSQIQTDDKSENCFGNLFWHHTFTDIGAFPRKNDNLFILVNNVCPQIISCIDFFF